jgi:hypothetical protein
MEGGGRARVSDGFLAAATLRRDASPKPRRARGDKTGKRKGAAGYSARGPRALRSPSKTPGRRATKVLAGVFADL